MEPIFRQHHLQYTFFLPLCYINYTKNCSSTRNSWAKLLANLADLSCCLSVYIEHFGERHMFLGEKTGVWILSCQFFVCSLGTFQHR